HVNFVAARTQATRHALRNESSPAHEVRWVMTRNDDDSHRPRSPRPRRRELCDSRTDVHIVSRDITFVAQGARAHRTPRAATWCSGTPSCSAAWTLARGRHPVRRPAGYGR